MGFRDLFPFKTEPPDAKREHEIAETSVVARHAPLRSGAKPHPFEGRRAYFRLAFKAMPVPGFPDEVAWVRYGDKRTKEEKRRTDVAWVELALREAGLDPDNVQPDVGRLAGLRAAVVHGGVEEPPLMHEGFRVLEQLARLLLRHRLGTGPYGWPLSPDDNNLRSPIRELVTIAHRFPRTEWRNADPEP